MSGFCGMYFKENYNYQEQEEKALLESMTNLITHRGPDDYGYYIDQKFAVGYRHLEISDAISGKQPFTNHANTMVIVFNGKLYNYDSLRKDMEAKEYKFITNSDMELVLYMYEQYGTESVEKLNGMFTFAIWDKQSRKIFGARDHFGIKPLYYLNTENRIGFASEIKCLLEIPEYTSVVDEQSFLNYLTFQYVPDPMTMFKDIMKIPAGHYFTIENDKIQIEKYWSIEFQPDESKSLDYFVEGIRENMRNAVKTHLVCDVSRGAFLSSGIDSSSIVALIKEIEDVKTFTVGFDCGKYNEVDFARETAKYLGTMHQDITITADMFWGNLAKLIWHQDEPVADPAAIALYFATKIASEHAKVVLSGEGADEVFGGYNIYHEPESLRNYQLLPSGIRKTFADIASILPDGMKGKSFFQRGAKSVEERFFGNAFIFDELEKRRISTLDDSFFQYYTKPIDITKTIYNRVQHYDDVTKMQYLDMHTWMTGDIMMKADRMSTANSIEVRMPFMDKQVFEFAATIPTKFKINNGTTKFALREAMKQVLPEQVANRRKLGFPVPIRNWLRTEFYQSVKELIINSQTEYLLDKQAVLALLEMHKAGKVDVSRKLWTIIVFMLWHQTFIEK